ncbi:MAG: MBL fold metallo-hydrolase [Candidatus Bathyarchaeota archaeon]
MREFPPDSDQFELTLFGPGYGECAVVHLGANRWIVVDSCLDTTTRKPAVLEYFNAIGVSAQEAVRLIVISHWHDDHVRGLSDVVSSCPNALVCYSSALTKNEFLAYILNYENIMTQTTSSGVSEIKKTFQILSERRPFRRAFAIANRPVLNLPAEGTADSCIVTTLSPSDKEFDLFLRGIAELTPLPRQTKKRASYLRPNHAAVALWIESSSVKMLLGSDIEEKGDSLTGWAAIVHSAERPQGRSSIYKVAHHGSVTGHHDKVWSDMMIQHPIAVLSPFYHAGKKVPTDKDVARIVMLAPESYITTQNPVPKSKISRSSPVERTIRETVGKIRAAQPPMGWVSLRNGGKSNPNRWDVVLSPTASRLSAFSGGKH